MSDPEALVQWCLENKQSLAKVLQDQGMAADEVRRLISQASPISNDGDDGGAGTPAQMRRGKFSQLTEAQPSPMTDSEYANVLRGLRRDGT